MGGLTLATASTWSQSLQHLPRPAKSERELEGHATSRYRQCDQNCFEVQPKMFKNRPKLSPTKENFAPMRKIIEYLRKTYKKFAKYFGILFCNGEISPNLVTLDNAHTRLFKCYPSTYPGCPINVYVMSPRHTYT
jgi:hypothetical protein